MNKSTCTVRRCRQVLWQLVGRGCRRDRRPVILNADTWVTVGNQRTNCRHHTVTNHEQVHVYSPSVQTSSLTARRPRLSTWQTSCGIKCWHLSDCRQSADKLSTSHCDKLLKGNVGSWTPPNVALKSPRFVCANNRARPATQCGRIGPVSSTLLTCPPDDCCSTLPCLTCTQQQQTGADSALSL